MRQTFRKIVAFHERRKEQPRSVFKIRGSTPQGLFVTGGQILSPTAGFFGAISANDIFFSSLNLWVLLGSTVVGGIAGTYFFPKPYEYDVLIRHSDEDLKNLTLIELTKYKTKLDLFDIKDSGISATRKELVRTQQRVKRIPGAPKNIRDLSLNHLLLWERAEKENKEAIVRWARYEIDAELQAKYPAMTDTSQEPTARLMKAMRQARNASSDTDIEHYAKTVTDLTQALDAAEEHARNFPLKPPKGT